MTLLSSCALSYIRALTLLLVSLPMAFAECPRIVSRDEWGAQTPSSKTPQQVPVPFVVIHHGGIAEYCDNETSCGEQARAYQSLHMDTRGWDDIGYSFLVGEDGNVYEGRGWHRVGAHAPQYNNQSIGVCIIGDFSERLPNRKALDAVERLISCGLEKEFIVPNYTILGHRQTRDTQCPGEVLYQEITSWPHWDPNPSPRKYHPHPGQGSTFALSSLALLTALASLLLDHSVVPRGIQYSPSSVLHSYTLHQQQTNKTPPRGAFNIDKIRPCVCGEYLVPGLVPRPGPALEAAVSLWLEIGSVPPLERALLAGYGHVLQGRASRLPRVANFLRNVPIYQGRIARIHEAAAEGRLTDLARLMDREAWGASRDEGAAGSTPLQKAMLGGHVAAVKLLLRRASCSLVATDRMGRAPLHYAAALDAMNRDTKGSSDVGWYQLLLEAGADEKVKDSLGRTPIFYRECCSELLQRHECKASSTSSSSSSEEDEGDPPVLVFHVTVEVREMSDQEVENNLVNHGGISSETIKELA